jgi:uncharacterized membrane protein
MRPKLSLLLSIAFITVLTLVGAGMAQAQEGEQARVTRGLMFFTSYPAQEMAIGEGITFPLVLRTDDAPQTARFELNDLPDGWTATFKGGGRVIEAAYVEPDNDTKVDLRVDAPAEVKPGSYQFTVIAQGERDLLELPIELVVKDKLPPGLSLKVDLPTLKGSPSTTFRYNATLKNEGDQDMSVNLVADAPSGLQVSFKLSGQEVTDIPLAANESKRVDIEAKPYLDLPAGQYPVNVLAQSSEAQASIQVTAEVTGQPDLQVSAPDGRLSGEAYVGDTTPLKLVVQNNGSAPVRDIKLSASQPNGWQVEFEPGQIAELDAGKQVEVTANVQPADQAIAGDYVVTVRAQPEDGASKSADFRITVLTSTLWGITGVGLIAIAVVVVGLTVMRFGRR